MTAGRRPALAFSWSWLTSAILVGVAGWLSLAVAAVTMAMVPSYRNVRVPSALGGWV